MKNLEGIEVICILEDDENKKLFDIENNCIPYIYSIIKQPDSALSFKSSLEEIVEWIKSQTGIKSQKKYYFRCSKVWVEIKINEINLGVKSLWNHKKYLNESYGCGFILVDEQMEKMIEVGCDSRDKENYLYDRYSLTF